MTKTKLLFGVLLLFVSSVFAQQGINYKAIISNNGSLIQSQEVEVYFTILLDGEQSVYEETNKVFTDDNGIIILNIGQGEPTLGSFADIDWSLEYYLNVQVNIADGNGFLDMGTNAFHAVPYAKYAEFAGNAGGSGDADFYKVGTTESASDINDDIFHMGNVSLGVNTIQSGKLNVALSSAGTNSYERTSLYLSNENTSDWVLQGISNDVFGPGTGNHFGITNTLWGDGTGMQVGTKNGIGNDGNGIHYGNYSDLSGGGSGEHYGAYNELRGAGTGMQFGVKSDIGVSGDGNHFGTYSSLSGDGSGAHFGMYNEVSGTGTGMQQGLKNYIDNSGNGLHYGLSNVLVGEGTGIQYGTYNYISNTGRGKRYGTVNDLKGDSDGFRYGTYNKLSGTTSMGTQYGVLNEISSASGTEYAIHYGVRSDLTGTGYATLYGTYNIIDGEGTGDKYGTYNRIPSTAAGNHYAVYGEAKKEGSYAGYFDGDVKVTGAISVPEFTTEDITVTNDLSVTNNATITGDLAVTGNVTSDLKMGDNEIHATETGDADMKAFKYGRFATYNGGVIMSGGSGGFTFSGGNGGYVMNYYGQNVTIVANFIGRYDDPPTFLKISYGSYLGESDAIYFKTCDLSGNQVDRDGVIHFVLYKD